MRFRADERGLSYQHIIALVTLIAFSLTYAFVTPIFNETHDMAVNKSDETRYEEYADNGIGYVWDAKASLPFVVMLLVTVFLFAKAVLLGSRGI
jgi:hypothetical protein